MVLLLQSTHMSSGRVSEATVYSCTGNPMPQDIAQVVEWLFGSPFQEAFSSAPPAIVQAVVARTFC